MTDNTDGTGPKGGSSGGGDDDDAGRRVHSLETERAKRAALKRQKPAGSNDDDDDPVANAGFKLTIDDLPDVAGNRLTVITEAAEDNFGDVIGIILQQLSDNAAAFSFNGTPVLWSASAEDDRLRRASAGFAPDDTSIKAQHAHEAVAKYSLVDLTSNYELLKWSISKHVARFKRLVKKNGDERFKLTALSTVELKAIARHGAARLAPLHGVAENPLLHEGDVLMGWKGYDKSSRMMIHSRPVDVEQWDDEHEALAWLCDTWLDGFGFDKRGDKIKAIAFALTLMLRPTSIRGGSPMFAFTSADPNTGKTLLVQAIATGVRGTQAPVTLYPTNREEFEKSFLSHLSSGSNMLFFDNVPDGHIIKHLSLEAYVTSISDSMDFRTLGATASRTISTTPVVCVTGNNLGFSSALETRIIEPRLSNVGSDKQIMEQVLEFTRANRGRIIGALLCVSGAKDENMGRLKGRMRDWLDKVAKPLSVVHGSTDWMIEWEQLEEHGSQSSNMELSNLMIAIQDEQRQNGRVLVDPDTGLTGSWITTSGIVENCENDLTALFPYLSDKLGNAGAVGHALSRFKGTSSGGLRLICRKLRNEHNRKESLHWTVVSTDGSAPPEPATRTEPSSYGGGSLNMDDDDIPF